jgi:hypothetical protein
LWRDLEPSAIGHDEGALQLSENDSYLLGDTANVKKNPRDERFHVYPHHSVSPDDLGLIFRK